MRLRLTVAYDGTGFRGWARQPGDRTVEGVLRRSARRTSTAPTSGLVVAGRTDTGVHALANVVSVDVEGGAPPERAVEALNTVLPGGSRGRPRPRRLRRTSMRASLLARVRIATGSGAAASARRSRSIARSGIRARSICSG